MSPTALVKAIASLTSISVTTEAGTFVAIYDEHARRINLQSQLLDGPTVTDTFQVNNVGGFAIASTAAILSKASKFLHKSNGTHAMVKINVKADGQASEYEFPLPLRSTTIAQMRTFIKELQEAHAKTQKRTQPS